MADLQEKQLAETISAFEDRIANIWRADRKLAPEFVFVADDDEADCRDCEQNEFPYKMYIKADSFFDELFGLDSRYLLESIIERYYENVNENWNDAFDELACNLELIEVSEFPSEAEYAKQKLGQKLFDDNFKKKVEQDYFNAVSFRAMLSKNTQLCINDLLDKKIDISDSEDLIRANIRDSIITGGEASRSMWDDETSTSIAITLAKIDWAVKEYFGNLVGKSQYEQHGSQLLPKIISYSLPDSLQYITLVSNLDQREEADKLKKYYDKTLN